MVSVSFANPIYLFFLLLIPLFIFIHFFTLKSSKSTALRFANFPAIAKIKGVDFFSKNIVITGLSVLILFLLIMSLSGMIFHTVINASSYSFVLALDTSQSMEANDILPSRMEAAKSAALDFVDSVPIGTQIGVISFSGNAFIEQDVTQDKGLIKSGIGRVEISDISGSDLHEAVITSTNLLKGQDTRAIIMLSDGQINVGSIADAIVYSNNNEVIVHTIAVGTEEGGITSYGLSKLDEDSLKALAYNTEGEFFKVEPSEIELRRGEVVFVPDKDIYLDFLNQALQKTQRKVGINLSSYLLIAAVILFGLEFFLINSRYKRLV